VSFSAITRCITSERVFIVVSLYFIMTQSGNFWIQLHIRGTNVCLPVKPIILFYLFIFFFFFDVLHVLLLRNYSYVHVVIFVNWIVIFWRSIISSILNDCIYILYTWTLYYLFYQPVIQISHSNFIDTFFYINVRREFSLH